MHARKEPQPGRGNHPRRLRGMPRERHLLGSPQALPQLRPRRLLRFLAAPARHGTPPADLAPGHSVVPARRRPGAGVTSIRRLSDLAAVTAAPDGAAAPRASRALRPGPGQNRVGCDSSPIRCRPMTSPTATSSWCRTARRSPPGWTSRSHRRWQRHHDSRHLGQHDGGLRPADGRDGSPPGRPHRAAAGHPGGRRRRRGVLGEEPAIWCTTPRSRSARTRPPATRSACCPSGRTEP